MYKLERLLKTAALLMGCEWYAPQKPPSDSELLRKYIALKFFYIKTECMQEGPRVKKYPIAIQFLGTYVIVIGVSNFPGNIEMETSSSTCISMQKNCETMNFWSDSESLVVFVVYHGWSTEVSFSEKMCTLVALYGLSIISLISVLMWYLYF